MSLLWSPCTEGLGMRGKIQCLFCWPSYSMGFHIYQWYHCLCVLPPGHKGCEEGGCHVRMNCRSQDNFDKSEGLRFSAWSGSDALPGPFSRSDESIHILRVWFGPDLQLEQNWSEVQAKVDAHVATWLQRKLSLKDRVKVCTTYIFALILYRLSVLLLPEAHWLVLQRSLTRCSEEVEGQWTADRSAFNIHAMGF